MTTPLIDELTCGDLVIPTENIHEHEYSTLVRSGSILIFNRREEQRHVDVIVLYDPTTVSTIIINVASMRLERVCSGTFNISPPYNDQIFYGVPGGSDVAEW